MTKASYLRAQPRSRDQVMPCEEMVSKRACACQQGTASSLQVQRLDCVGVISVNCASV